MLWIARQLLLFYPSCLTFNQRNGQKQYFNSLKQQTTENSDQPSLLRRRTSTNDGASIFEGIAAFHQPSRGMSKEQMIANVSHSKESGLFVNNGLMTIDGNGTTIHHNCTDGGSYHYGLHTDGLNLLQPQIVPVLLVPMVLLLLPTETVANVPLFLVLPLSPVPPVLIVVLLHVQLNVQKKLSVQISTNSHRRARWERRQRVDKPKCRREVHATQT